MTLNAMRPDIIVVRHHAAGAVELLSQKVDCSVINAGDGAHQHPTQALLDALTIRRAKGRIAGLTVAICGDILHSRVARSNINVLNALGARVRIVAPSTLLPSAPDRLGCEVFTDMWKGIDGVDIVMMLRLQRERMEGSYVPSSREFFHFFGLDHEKLARAKPDALVMHPGPDEPRRRDRLDRRRSFPQRHSRAGGDGRRGPHGRAGSAVRPPPGIRGGRPMSKTIEKPKTVGKATVFINARLIDPGSQSRRAGRLARQGWPDRRSSAAICGATRRKARHVIDCKGHVLAPGLIDAQVFTGEPGYEHRETLKTASHAAAAGGVTTIVVMPETNPVIDQVALVDFIQRRARDNALVHVHTMAAMTKGLKGEEMTEIGLLEAGRRDRFLQRQVERRQHARDAQRAALRQGFRRAHRPPHRGPLSLGQRCDEFGRGGGAARTSRRFENCRDDHAGARRAPRRDDGRALSRRRRSAAAKASRSSRAPRQGSCRSRAASRSII